VLIAAFSQADGVFCAMLLINGISDSTIRI